MTVDEAIAQIWDYHHVKHPLQSADLIFVLGSNDPRVATWAAELYARGYAGRILFSGGAGRFTEGQAGTEAERFALVARQAGVPGEDILVENKSTNTGENVLFSKALLEKEGLEIKKVLAVQKPYMERRTLATLDIQWPEVEVIVSSPPLSFEEYLSEDLPFDLVVSAMVGDFQRIMMYPAQGFSSPQPLPEEAVAAYETLVSAGFTSQLLQA